MKLEYKLQEFSVGRYVYVLDDIDDSTNSGRICYIWYNTPKATDFLEWICQNPEKISDVKKLLSSGKEINAEAITILLIK